MTDNLPFKKRKIFFKKHLAKICLIAKFRDFFLQIQKNLFYGDLWRIYIIAFTYVIFREIEIWDIFNNWYDNWREEILKIYSNYFKI